VWRRGLWSGRCEEGEVVKLLRCSRGRRADSQDVTRLKVTHAAMARNPNAIAQRQIKTLGALALCYGNCRELGRAGGPLFSSWTRMESA
jgi:hypothetical protein